MADQVGMKRRLIDGEMSKPKRMKVTHPSCHRSCEDYIPINQKEQLTRKEIANRLHFESFNDENTKVFTKNDQLSLLNNKREKFNNLDKKIEKLSAEKNYQRTGSGMMNMLSDLCELEENDSDLDEEYHRKRDKKRMELQRIVKIDEKCEKYEGNLKNIEWTKRVKGLTIECRERALSKVLQVIKQNHSQNESKIDEKSLKVMSIESEFNVCKRANTETEYAKCIRDQLHQIRAKTKAKKLFEIEVIASDGAEEEEGSGSDDDESESESDDDDDLPIGARLKSTESTITEDGSLKSSNQHDLDSFIQTYKLNQIEDKLRSEGVTIDFLLSQNKEQIKQIAKELTNKIIQQNKFIYAVNKLKSTYTKSTSLSTSSPKTVVINDLSFECDEDEKQIEHSANATMIIKQSKNEKNDKKTNKIILHKFKNNDEERIKCRGGCNYFGNKQQFGLCSQCFVEHSVTMKRSKDGKSLIISYRDEKQIICVNGNKTIKDMQLEIEQKFIRLGLNKIATRPFRWRLNGKYGILENVLNESTAVNALNGEYKLEESVQIIINNKRKKYYFVTQNFEDLGLKYCKIMPSDVVLTVNDQKYDIFHRVVDLALTDNDHVSISNIRFKPFSFSKIFCKTLTGKVLITQIDLSKHTVFDWKYLIQQKQGIPTDYNRVIFEGKELENYFCFCDYKIPSESTLILLLRVRG